MSAAAVFDIRTLMPERLIQRAAQAGIVFEKLEKADGRTLKAHVRAHDVKTLKELLDGLKIEYSYVYRRRLMGFVRERPALLLSVALCACLLYMLAGRVWIIDVGGFEGMSEILSGRGVSAGIKRDEIDVSALSKALMAQMPEYAFVSVKLSGVKLTVRPVYADEAPTVFDLRDSRDIVSDRDCVILSVDALAGTPVVKVGDTVRKGDVLISGTERKTPDGETSSVRAAGVVSVRTWTRAEARVALNSKEKRYTGRTSMQADIISPIWSHRLFGENPFAAADAKTARLAICGLFLPANVVRTEWLEYVYADEAIPESNAKAVSEALAIAKARKLAPQGAVESDMFVSSEIKTDGGAEAVAVIEWICEIS